MTTIEDVIAAAERYATETATRAEEAQAALYNAEIAGLESEIARLRRTPPPPAPEETLLRMNLAGIPDGPLSFKNFYGAFGVANSNTGAIRDLHVGTDETGRFIRTVFPTGTVPGGMVAGIPLMRKVFQAALSVSVRFSPDFDWSLGGKLLGLFGVVDRDAAGKPVAWSFPSGGKADPEGLGYSDRWMWGPNGRLESYIYHPGQNNIYGDGVSVGYAPAGRKVHLRKTNRLNTVGRGDGVIKAEIEGKVAMQQRGYVLRKRDDLYITHFGWSHFRGGSGASWAGKRPGHVDIYDDLAVTTPAT